MGSAVDRPVETGHELVLATLLVHYDVDEIDQLPLPLQRVVQDVYDITANLAEAKIAFQWETYQLREELARVRAELHAERRTRNTDNVTSTTPASLSAEATAMAAPGVTSIENRERLRSTVSRLATSMSPTNCRCRTKPTPCAAPSVVMSPWDPRPHKPEKPDWNGSTRIKSSSKVAAFSVAAAGTPVARSGVRAYLSWASAPARLGSSRAAQVTPLPPPNQPAQETTTPQLTASQKAVSTTQRSRSGVRECLQQQLDCERSLHVLGRTFGQVVLWQVAVRDDQLVILVPHLKGIVKQAHGHSVEAIQAALAQVCDEVEDLRSSCEDSLHRVIDLSLNKPWLVARRDKLHEMLCTIEKWIHAIASMMHKFSSQSIFSRATVESATATVATTIAVWNAVDDADTVNHTAITAKDVKVLCQRHNMPTMWKPSTVAFVEYAIASFTMQALEVFVTNFILGDDFDALTTIGEIARELQSIDDQFHGATKSLTKASRIVAWQDALNVRHAKVLQSIQRRALACSETICGVTTRLCPLSTAPLPRTTWTTTPESFPSDYYSWEVYEDIIVAIVSCHVVLTRLSEVQECSRAAAKMRIIARLTMLEELMAPWADPRFATETHGRALEQREYLKLMDWCDVLREIVASHIEPTVL